LGSFDSEAPAEFWVNDPQAEPAGLLPRRGVARLLA
jgi:hypothetical protein